MPDDIWKPFDLEKLRALGRDPPQSDDEALFERRPPKPKPPPATDSEPKAKRSRREDEPFLHVGIPEFLAGAQAVNSAQELLVWAFILRERRVREGIGQPMTFALTNASLRKWGINKDTKARAVRKLIAAGRIRVERDGRQSPRVTVCRLL